MPVSTILQPAFILHTRSYRETSFLLDIFTLNHGRISAVARGIKSSRKRQTSGLILPFVPLLLSWTGKNELVQLTQTEPNGCAYNLTGRALLCGLYLNEILTKLLHRHDAHNELFLAYDKALLDLHNCDENFAQQQVLRDFELILLKTLGYEVRLQQDVLGNTIDSEANYLFTFGIGLQKINDYEINNFDKNKIFSGRSLNVFANGQLTLAAEFYDAKRLMRQALEVLMENKKLKTRELF